MRLPNYRGIIFKKDVVQFLQNILNWGGNQKDVPTFAINVDLAGIRHN